MGVLHGDLKGVSLHLLNVIDRSSKVFQANILIKNDAHACLSDFGLTAVTYDPNTVNAITTSSEAIGSVRWMAPEIIHPEESGLPRRRPSPESDIYALGMVIWEVHICLSLSDASGRISLMRTIQGLHGKCTLL